MSESGERINNFLESNQAGDPETIILLASDNQEIQELVNHAKNKVEAITAVREKLRDTFPEIEKLPDLIPGRVTASNEYIIAKAIVELLWRRSKND